MVFERLHHLGDRRELLSHRDIDAHDPGVPLIDDRVHRNRGLAGLPVADDEFTLAAADGNHRVHGFHSGLERLLHRLPGDDSRGNALHRTRFARFDRALAVERTAERVHHPALHGLTHRHLKNPPGAFCGVALLDRGDVAEEHESYRRFLEVQRESEHIVGEFHEFAIHDPFEAVYAGDPVTRRDNGSNFRNIHPGFVTGDLFPQQGCDFVCSNAHCASCKSLILGVL